MSPNVNYGIGVIIMCRCVLTGYNKHSTLGAGGHDGEDYACVETGSPWEFSIPHTQFCYEPKTALKKVLLKQSTERVTEIQE